MADFGALSKLTKKADAVATSASVLVSRSIREIRGELANLTAELNIAGSADDRERAYQMIRDKMGRLSRQLNRLLVAQNNLSAQAAARSASTMTGVEIKYSAKRAKAITEMVTPAQGENLAAVFTDKMGANLIQSLREATVSTMRENAVAGGSMKEMARTMSAKWHAAVKDGVPKFVDSSGREWNTAAYFQMNVRTNTMRVYNDCLIDDVARETGSDVMRISSGGSDPACECASWEGTLISLTGKTPGLPTYEDAKAGGCFHPNCVHTLEVVDEYADKAEIERAQAHPFERPEDDGDIWEAQDNRKYEIDQAVYREQGMDAEQARVAVDRDNLAASIRAGLIREDADAVVAKMTDAQVTALCKDGNPPEFEPFKPTKKELADGAKERWNHGKWGGVVHIAKSATAEDILKVCKVDGEPTAPNSSNSTPPTPPKPKDDKSTVQKTDAAHGDLEARMEEWQKRPEGTVETNAAKVIDEDKKLSEKGITFVTKTGKFTYEGINDTLTQAALTKFARPVTKESDVVLTKKRIVAYIDDLRSRFPNMDIPIDCVYVANHKDKNTIASTLCDNKRTGLGVYDGNTMIICLDNKKIDRSDEVEIKRQFGTRGTVARLDERMKQDYFTHELGHLKTTREMIVEFGKVYDAVGGKDYFFKNVSVYASVKDTEAIAEVFALMAQDTYRRGTLDKRIEDLFYSRMFGEKIGGEK